MQKLARILAVTGVLVLATAIVWHFSSVVYAVQERGLMCVFRLNTSPSNIVTFGNSLMLLALLIMVGKKER